LLPPMKLYLESPDHLAAGGGSPGRNSGAKSNDPKVMNAVSLVAPSLWVFAGRRQLVDLQGGGCRRRCPMPPIANLGPYVVCFAAAPTKLRFY
jgi:hypothetical protein